MFASFILTVNLMMDSVWNIIFLAFAFTTLILFAILKIRQEKRWPHADHVILHQLPRGPHAPSVSPFPLKLETFLRMAKIPYETDFTRPFSYKGKTPWITYKGLNVADSQFSIEHLRKSFHFKPSHSYSSTDLSIARAFQKMAEENLYWCMCAVMFGPDLQHVRSLLPYNKLKSALVAYILRLILKLEMWGHGIGRHTLEEIIGVGCADMQAIANFLGDKQFLLGDEPCEADCAIFGVLAQIKWHSVGTKYQQVLEEELVNLSEYCTRMKDMFWPDWEDVVTVKDAVE